MPHVSTRNASLWRANVWFPHSFTYIRVACSEEKGCLPPLFAYKQSQLINNGEQKKEREEMRGREVGLTMASWSSRRTTTPFPPISHLIIFHRSQLLTLWYVYVCYLRDIWSVKAWFCLSCRERWKKVY